MPILFMEDWKKYPKAAPDWDTPNKSFVEIALLYRSLGVKNFSFPLALVDPGLKGVDPYDPNITQDLAIRIGTECKVNPWYWFREIARDPGSSPDNPVRLIANRGIISAYWLYFNHVLTVLIMIRQTGKSFGIDWLVQLLLNCMLTKSEISYLTKDDALRTRELERLKSIELSLPPYLKMRRKQDPASTEMYRIGRLGNSFRAYVGNANPKAADIIGRGMTTPTVFVDEFAYVRNSSITIPVMLAGSPAARELAITKNEPYGTIFMTTTGKRDTPEGGYAFEFVNNSAVWAESFLDCSNLEELERVIRAASPKGKVWVNCTFNHRQLGKTDEWLKNRMEASLQDENNPVQIKADFFNAWPSGTTESPFTPEQAEAMRNSEKNHETELAPPEGYALRWYYPEAERETRMAAEDHILSVDPSDAVGSDAIGVTVRRLTTGEVVMAADISEGNLIQFCRWLCSFMVSYRKVTVIVERRSSGATILDYLLDFLPSVGINPFERLYNQVVQFADEFPDRFQEIQNPLGQRENLFAKYKKFFGWATSASGTTSRRELMSRTLQAAAKMTGGLMHDRKLILQTLGLEIRNNRLDHAAGGHDDLTFSWVLSYWLMSQGKNLSYYGIDSRKVMQQNPFYLDQLKEISAYERHRNSEANSRVEFLTQQLRQERNEYVARRLEYDLEQAIAQLSQEDRQIITTDELIQKLREERRKHLPVNTATNLLQLLNRDSAGTTNDGGFYRRPENGYLQAGTPNQSLVYYN